MRLLVAPRDLNRDPQRAQRRTEQSLLSAPRRLGTTVRAPEGSADWDGLIVLCAANNWDDVKLADRHMAEQLAPMRRCSTSIRPCHTSRASRIPRSPDPCAGRVSVWSALGSRATRPSSRRSRCTRRWSALTTRLVRRQLRRAVHQLGGESRPSSRRGCSWTPTASAASAAACTGGRTTGGRRRSLGCERRAARRARGASRPGVRPGRRRQRGRGRPLEAAGCAPPTSPTAATRPYFAGVDDVAPAADVETAGPVAGFVGHLNSRTDLALLEAIADAGVSLLLIGPKDHRSSRNGSSAVERDNVAYLGARPFETLPAYLKRSTSDSSPTRHRVQPLQLPDEDARVPRGRPTGRRHVVPAVRWLDTDLVTLADTPEPSPRPWP